MPIWAFVVGCSVQTMCLPKTSFVMAQYINPGAPVRRLLRALIDHVQRAAARAWQLISRSFSSGVPGEKAECPLPAPEG